MCSRSIQNQMNPVDTHPVSRSILIFPPTYIKIFWVVSFILVFLTWHFVCITLGFLCVLCVLPLSLYHRTDIWGGIQTMKLFMLKCCSSCYLLTSVRISSSHTLSPFERPRDWVKSHAQQADNSTILKF